MTMARTATYTEDLAALCRHTLAQDGPAVRFEGQWTSKAQIRAVASGVEAALDAAGVPPGAPVAFAPRNSPASLAAFLPLLAQQRRVRMLYPFQSPEALAARMAECDVAALVMERHDFAPAVLRALSTAGIAGIALDPGGAAMVGTRGQARSALSCVASAPALEILTSGTTGPPKPFAIGYDVVLGYVRQAEALAGTRTGPTAPPLLCFPLSNISGLYSLAMSFLCGERVILLERFSVAAWRDYVAEFRPPAGGGPPAALAMILEAQIPREDLASLRSFSTGAAPVDPAVRARFESTYGIPVLQTYGATEFGGPVTALSLDLLRTYGADKAASVGRPFGRAEIRIRREEDGALAAAGEVGRVEVISPRMGPEWIVTSDLGSLDADGFLTLFGRADGAIQRGGFKIVPERVEQVLLAHPEVAEVAVVGVPEPRLHEVPGALVVPRDPDRPPEARVLNAHVRAHLPATHVPVHWRFAGALPRTVSFKTDRGAVRALLAGAAVSPDR
ncbi:class I adenylate-forming enzyme family protein [Novosphingobium sp. BW1]|uniref:class I adenylate-forming enzyme family protein n=1 Tax=Novosphingobium sp. BW1 TaxID=2592621 RepID=UPI0011DE824C|nr:fatty acid--CoA ligase family protein [Novosphingobium sp. BW1]TYC89589.1 long-chain fatty acid--CoA ligase [Novosphingobium sp. BW1]